MVVAQVELTDEEAERLQDLARQRRLSVAEVIHDTLMEKLLLDPRPITEETRRRALSIAGRYRSGVGDLGQNHDKYLAEAFGQ